MKFEEVFSGLREGKMARRPNWDKGVYILFQRKDGIVDNGGDLFEIHHAYVMADDWEFLPETKKFVAWVNLRPDGSAFVWESKEEADEFENGRVECRRIEWEVSE